MGARHQRVFWTRVTLTAFVVNMPLASLVAIGAMSFVFGLGISALLGVAVLLIWDSSRRAVSGDAGAPSVDGLVRQREPLSARRDA